MYCSANLIVILGLCVVKTHLKGLIVIECFASYEFPALASFFNQQGQNIQSRKLSDFRKKVSLLIKQKSRSLLKKYGIQRMMLMVDNYHSLNVCTMKTLKTILTPGETFLCRKLSKVINFPLQ